jgi:hypothetical protein
LPALEVLSQTNHIAKIINRNISSDYVVNSSLIDLIYYINNLNLRIGIHQTALETFLNSMNPVQIPLLPGNSNI